MNTEDIARNSETRRQYSDWLKEYFWDDMLTVTFRSPRHEPYYALKHVESELKKHNVARGFLGCEPHQSGDLHIHGIIAGMPPGWRPEIELPWDIWSGLFKRFGRAKVEMCNKPENVANYCAKYILKQQNRACDYYSVFGTPLAWRSGKLDNR